MISSVMTGLAFAATLTAGWATLDWLAGSGSDYFTLFVTTAFASAWTAQFVRS